MNSYKRLFSAWCLIIMTLAMPLSLMAQGGNETVVEFFSDNATMEDDPNQGVYNITIYSPDGQWKMQLNYHSDSMFGTFTNDDFHLSTDGKYYNYARNPKNDMVFYSFTDMNVTVADEGTVYRVNANCLTNNNTRFIVEATIEAPKPTSFITDDLGYARVTPNYFYGTYTIKAENERYKLAYGIVSTDLLGTYYRADILMPELRDKQTGADIQVIYATAEHTQEGENTILKIDVISADHVQYTFTMFNGPYDVEVKEERDIVILSGVVLQNLTEIYGCYQFGGQNDEYGVAVAVTPDAIESGRTEWTGDDIFMPYTQILDISTGEFLDIFSATASLVDSEEGMFLNAEMLTMDGTLYHVKMTLQGGTTQPDTKETVNIDFGRLAVLDYSQGVGIVGLGAVLPGKYQMRCYLNVHNLEGSFANDEFIMDACDIMVVNEDENTYVFHDAKYVTASVETIDEVKHITVDMVGVDDVLYHATMTLEPLLCMHDMNLSVGADDEVLLIGMQNGYDGERAEYTLQLQDMENVYDDDYNVVGDGYALSFYFAHDGNTSIAGEYGYSAGTLAEDEPHTFFEKGCEVRIGAVAGTLTLEPKEAVQVSLGGDDINTYIYKVKAQFVGQNNVIYTAEGENFLLLLSEDGDWLSLDESAYTRIDETLINQGYKIKKVLKGGKVIIEKLDKEYDLNGRLLK